MILLIFFAVAGIVWMPIVGDSKEISQEFSIHFLDVGQGDAILIRTPDGIDVLVDGGRDASVLRRLSEVMSFNDRTIDLVIATHEDSDHIGGLIDVLERYEVRSVLYTENQGASPAAREYDELVLQEGAETIQARRGQVYQLGASTTLEVLWPEGDTSTMESNTSSIVVRVVYGDTSFLLTGDLPKRIEEYLVLAYGEHLESTVLKVGHHGSRTSTSELFLDEVNPEYALLSYGADNSYGHPHVEVTDMLFNARVETLSTAEEGTVSFISDGKEIWLE